MIFKVISRVVLLLYCGVVLLVAATETCPKAYGSCNLGKEGYINVHLISHTHDDVGWLNTVDEYYTGDNAWGPDKSVRRIITSSIEELEKDPKRRFVYVEMAFFWRWWVEQDEVKKESVRKLVNEKRLEFVIGGWAMNDEATTYYTDIIDQQTLGLTFILKEFGSCARPRSAWQIDPFGHSREQASLFGQMGFDGLFLGRIDYQDFEHRSKTKTMEMIWQGSENLGKVSRLFTGILPNGYSPPKGFCWDIWCGEPSLGESNAPQKVKDFIQYTHNQAKMYRTNTLVMTMGADFQYSHADMWFENLDRLISYVNKQQETSKSKVNIFYSTVACFLYALNRENQSWPLKTDDFFPYADEPHRFWSGYFTSRPSLKLNVKKTSNYMQVVRHLTTIADLGGNQTEQSLLVLERAMAVLQHHDGVSGTEKQHVAEDYAQRLWIGTEKCFPLINRALDEIFNRKLNVNTGGPSKFFYCSQLNITECLPIENKEQFNVLIYNPLPRTVRSWISVPVVKSNYELVDLGTGDRVDTETTLVFPELSMIVDRKSKANYNLVFNAQLPAMGFKTFSFTQKPDLAKSIHKKQVKLISSSSSGIEIENSHYNLKLDNDGNLIGLTNKQENLRTMISQSFCIYKSKTKTYYERPSGAYVFRPEEDKPDCLNVKSYTIHNTNQIVEVHQIYSEWISQTIRIYANTSSIEFEWQVGSLDMSDNFGKEVSIRFQSDLKSNTYFYTDSNGRESLRRKRDYRPTWNLNVTQPIAGNYYPINSQIHIRDEPTDYKRAVSRENLRQLTLLPDRSQGAASIFDGSLEVMLHRRTLYDDGLGVDEPLNEMLGNVGLVARGSLSLVFSSVQSGARLTRQLAHEINNRPLVLFSLDRKNDHLKKLSGWTALKADLPANVHLLTMRKDFDDTGAKSMLVRLEHFYELNEDDELSQPATVNLKNVLDKTFNLVKIEELALGGNMPIDELNEKLEWTSENTDYNEMINETHKVYKQIDPNNFEVTLNPMEIRTFRLYYTN